MIGLISGSGGTVTSVSGTTNQIDVATGTTTPAISLDAAITLPGTINKYTLTAPATGATLTIADGKTLTVNNTITFTATDGASLNVTNALTKSGTYAAGLPLSAVGAGNSAIAGCLGATSQKAETTTADANVLTVTPAAVVGTFRVNVIVSVSAATSGVIAWTLSWTDSNGSAQANIQQGLFQQGTAAPALSFTTSAAGNYFGTAVIDVNNAAAAIIVKWVGGGTTTAKMTATIERLV